MFTGLIEGIGRIERVDPLPDGGIRATVTAPAALLADARVGDSICVNGVCLTAVELAPTAFAVDVSRESLARSAGLDRPGAVNLERSLRLGDRLGGHLVFGHVDGVGEVVSLEPLGASWEFVVRVPRELARYVAVKGSVAVNGTSLTVNRVTDTPAGCEFSINLIPHTYEVTTLNGLRAGSRVNVEADMIARYVERMLQERAIPT
ncbi:MAG TPA: riboflavin synthase [Burkholderiaceae bacterium]|nr:riboflavin synthase [Burkholderiaceae bacterium]